MKNISNKVLVIALLVSTSGIRASDGVGTMSWRQMLIAKATHVVAFSQSFAFSGFNALKAGATKSSQALSQAFKKSASAVGSSVHCVESRVKNALKATKQAVLSAYDKHPWLCIGAGVVCAYGLTAFLLRKKEEQEIDIDENDPDLMGEKPAYSAVGNQQGLYFSPKIVPLDPVKTFQPEIKPLIGHSSDTAVFVANNTPISAGSELDDDVWYEARESFQEPLR